MRNPNTLTQEIEAFDRVRRSSGVEDLNGCARLLTGIKSLKRAAAEAALQTDDGLDRELSLGVREAAATLEGNLRRRLAGHEPAPGKAG